MAIDIATLTLKKAHDMLMSGELTSVDLVEAYLAQIQKRNPSVNAYLEVFHDVGEQAKKADERIKAHKAGKAGAAVTLFTGIPFAIKDNILIEGRAATSASRILQGYVAPYDATVIRKLKDAGAVFIGRTNMDEFAMGGSNENSAFGPVKNPHDEACVSGGSSGGSAAAVAMQGALLALGSDTGGSVRQPSSFCGVVGLKPTYGRISRHGLMAMGSSLDQIGPIGKTVADVKAVYDLIKGNDRMDSTSLADNLPSPAPKKAYTIGVPRNLLKTGLDPRVAEDFENALAILKAQGNTIRDIELPNSAYALAVYYVLMPAEASSNLSRFDGVKYGIHLDGKNLIDDYVKTRTKGFGKEVRRRIMLGNYILSAGYYDAYYNKAHIVRQLITDDYEKAFAAGVDVIVTPTSPMPAWKIGEKSHDPLQMYLADIFTVTANLTGCPALSVPSGKTKDSAPLPLGIQFTAPHLHEDILFSIGSHFLGE
jgi:aspartyl-tRNA(Asn)/glutamyl-tRNA(Gln) amidotransferase subunit A